MPVVMFAGLQMKQGPSMPKTMFHVRQEGVQFFLNTESSSPSSGHRNRYRLFKTDNFGRDKCGWVSVGSTVGQALIAMTSDADRFDGCVAAFASKRPHLYGAHGDIRGKPGKWEGEAFPLRVTQRRDASVSSIGKSLKRQEE